MFLSDRKRELSPQEHLSLLCLAKGLSKLIQARRDLQAARTELAAALLAHRSAHVSAEAGCHPQPELNVRSTADVHDKQQGPAENSGGDLSIKPAERAGPRLQARAPSRPASVGEHCSSMFCMLRQCSSATPSSSAANASVPHSLRTADMMAGCRGRLCDQAALCKCRAGLHGTGQKISRSGSLCAPQSPGPGSDRFH